MAEGIQSFREFVQSVASARHEDFRTRADAKVESAAAFEEMRQHVLYLYRDVEARHTFLETGGQIVDCIPIEQQPAARCRQGKISTPPPFPKLVDTYEAPSDRASTSKEAPKPGPQSKKTPPPQLDPSFRDRFGNQMWCPPRTIPMIRVTLEKMSRFRNLRDFFSKAPDGFVHRHAVGFQSILNSGGMGSLNTWQPAVEFDQVFSLSQLWFIGGTGAAMQTVECGWQVYPGKYPTLLPCLFIYWTKANYAPGTGCYNLDCDAFCQTDSSFVLGGALSPSQPGVDTQVQFRMGFVLAQGEWWFYLGGQPVGYYPAEIYDGGALTNGAGLIQAGGETVPNASFPPMGSGAFPDSGFGLAAYQSDIRYSRLSGGLLIANLDPFQSSPACYTVAIATNSGVADWNTYLFFGGPGGQSC